MPPTNDRGAGPSGSSSSALVGVAQEGSSGSSSDGGHSIFMALDIIPLSGDQSINQSHTAELVMTKNTLPSSRHPKSQSQTDNRKTGERVRCRQ